MCRRKDIRLKMPIEIKMPALSPTMEEGTLAKWFVKPGDQVQSGDIMAEIETDKATMEFEAVDEGTLLKIEVGEGTENVKVGAVIAILAGDSEDEGTSLSTEPDDEPKVELPAASPSARKLAEANSIDLSQVSGTGPNGKITKGDVETAIGQSQEIDAPEITLAKEEDRTKPAEDRIIASPLAKRIAGDKGIDLRTIQGTGPNGRIVKEDVLSLQSLPPASSKLAPKSSVEAADLGEPPYDQIKLNNVRKIIARRLTEAKQEIPHIYLTVDVVLDPLLELRAEINASLQAEGIKVSVNDLIIKALAKALKREPQCNVSFQGDVMHQYSRQDISVAVAAPSGLITPIIKDAGNKGISEISSEMKVLAEKAREGKLQPHEYQGGTASLSNLGMFGTKQFGAVINPPQAMILAVGAGERRPHIIEGELGVATVMSVTGSFDHRAIDGVDGAKLLDQFRDLIERPIGLVV